MNRRNFIKSASGLFVPATFGIFVPKLSAQFSRTPAFKAAAVPKVAGGGGDGSFAFSYVTGTAIGTSPSVTHSPTVGNLVVFYAKWEGTGDMTDVSSNASTPDVFTLLTQSNHNNGDIHSRIGWKVIANAGANILTGTWTGTPTFRRIRVVEFSKAGGTVAVDAGIYPTTPSTTGTSFTTSGPGTLTTTTNNSLVICTYAEYASGLPTSPQIGGVSATMFPGNLDDGSSQLWYRILTATIAGASGTATVADDAWVGQLVAWKST